MPEPESLQSRVLGISRIAIGFLYWTHGAQKLLGWFGGFGPEGGTADLMSRFGIAAVLETFGGLAIMLGLAVRPVAFILSGEMAVAYWWIHVSSGGLWPWANGGEKVAFYSFYFLFLAAAGGGAFSLDAWRRRRAEPSAA